MKRVKTAQRVCVAMSGGVDSSVAALLLVRAGYRVTGVFMKPWQPRGFSCLWQQDRADALRVASELNIPFETWDFSREYARHVSRPMVQSYREGRTPNPDVECNRHIKFGLFYRRALKRGADFIATGHYARVERGRDDSYSLRVAKDANKDQTYFLWGLHQRQLPHILFPIGHLKKPAVRKVAAHAELETALKKDSQGVCFVGPLDVKAFLQTTIKPRRGAILHADGTPLGEHDGAGYYTIGQRHGLNIRVGGGPYFVIRKDMKRNTITVGPSSLLATRVIRIGRIHWIGNAPKTQQKLAARIRYRAPLVSVRIVGSEVRCATPVSAPAAGQSIVFYDGDRVAGGAIVR